MQPKHYLRVLAHMRTVFRESVGLVSSDIFLDLSSNVFSVALLKLEHVLLFEIVTGVTSYINIMILCSLGRSHVFS